MPSVDIGAETYPAYADQDYADVFLLADARRSASWAARTPDTKGRGLVTATRLLQRQTGWTDGAPDINDPPEAVKEVTSMLADDILAKPLLGDDARQVGSNVKRAKGGPAEVEFFRAIPASTILPQYVIDLLLAAGLWSGSDSGDGGPVVSGVRSASHFPDECGDVVPWRDTGWPGVGCG